MALFGKKKKKGAPDEIAPEMPGTEAVPFQEEAVEEANVAVEKPAKPPKPKVRADVYTLLLGLSVVALIIASVLLFLNAQAYGPNPLAGFPKG